MAVTINFLNRASECPDVKTYKHGGAAAWAGWGHGPPKIMYGWVGHNAFGPTNNWPVIYVR